MWQLVINGPGYFDTKYDLPPGTTHVGRADENDIVLSGDLVSRKHARFHVTASGLAFEDLGSRNGSRLNGEKVSGTVPMKPGDVVAVGENSLVVRQPTTAESAATEMVDAGGGGAVRRFGRGVDVSHAVLMARDIQDSVVRKVLDNSLPFEVEPPPVPGKVQRRTRGDTDEHDAPSVEVRSDGPSYPVAFHSLVMLFRVAERLASAPTLQAFLDDATDTVMKRVGASTGVVLLRHQTGVMVPAAVRHARKLQKGEVPVSDAIVEAALAQGQAIAVADVRDDSRFADRESVVLYGVDQVLCVPIGAKAPFQGVLYLNRTELNEEPIEALLDLCTALAQLMQTAISRFAARPAGGGDRLRAALERFHAPDIVERRVAELGDKRERLSRLEEKQVTVLFADIAGFTELCQTLAPDEVSELLADLYRVATPLLFSFEGTVDKFMGDSVMALFGAPYGKGDDAIRAVRASMALKAEWERAMYKRPVAHRRALKVGLTTGKVLAGTVGTEARLDYTAIGEPVNVASWLCQSAEPGQVLITGKTLAAVGARFDVTPLGERPLLGSRVRTAIFEVLEEDDDSGTLSGIR